MLGEFHCIPNEQPYALPECRGYSHVTDTMQGEAAERLNSVFESVAITRKNKKPSEPKLS